MGITGNDTIRTPAGDWRYIIVDLSVIVIEAVQLENLMRQFFDGTVSCHISTACMGFNTLDIQSTQDNTFTLADNTVTFVCFGCALEDVSTFCTGCFFLEDLAAGNGTDFFITAVKHNDFFVGQ